jgi:hypothetical protein
MEVRLGAALGNAQLVLRAGLWPERTAPTGAGSAIFDLYSVGEQTCYVSAPAGVLAFRLCGALDLGHMRATLNDSDGALWAATFAEVGLAWHPSPHVAIQADVGPGVTLAAPRFWGSSTVSFGQILLYQPSTFVLRAGLSVDVLLW